MWHTGSSDKGSCRTLCHRTRISTHPGYLISLLYGNHTATVLNCANLAQMRSPWPSGNRCFPPGIYSSSQGSYDMGISPQALPGNVSLKDQAQHTGIANSGRQRTCLKEGVSLPAMTGATKNRRIKALYLMESNPLEHSDSC